eukprot:m.8154 g.8154  ORF g.8154 m.8154 type:complete len:1088 (+) comp20359_c0_seq2:495-3758(+)
MSIVGALVVKEKKLINRGESPSVETVYIVGDVVDCNSETGVLRVCWDDCHEAENIEPNGPGKKYSIYLLDGGPAGMLHEIIVCDMCRNKPLEGSRWSCRTCYDYQLCTQCYLKARDDHTEHAFRRRDYSHEGWVDVEPREKRQTLLQGNLCGGEVVRERADRNETGVIASIKREYMKEKDAMYLTVEVRWLSGVTETIRSKLPPEIVDALRHHGCYYFEGHLRQLDKDFCLQTRRCTPEEDKLKRQLQKCSRTPEGGSVQICQEDEGGKNVAIVRKFASLELSRQMTEGRFVWYDFDGCTFERLPFETLLSTVTTLSLGDCNIYSLPSSIRGLTALKTMFLHNNKIDRLPEEITQLQGLSGLSLANNRLQSLPESFDQLKNLTILWLDSNRFKSIPDQVCKLPKLERLTLVNNRITAVTDKIREVKTLRQLLLDSNCIQVLPRLLFQRWFDSLSVENNPLQCPPWAICKKGSQRALEYFEQLEKESIVFFPYRRRRVLVVGQTQSGKSSLIRALIYRQKTDTSIKTDSTVFIDSYFWPCSASSEDAPFALDVCDLGGLDIYYRTQVFFLTNEDLILLTVNMHQYDQTQESFDNLLGKWLDRIQTQVPDAEMVVVGTHGDKCQEDQLESKKKDISSKIKAHQKKRVDFAKQALTHDEWLKKKHSGFPDQPGVAERKDRVKSLEDSQKKNLRFAYGDLKPLVVSSVTLEGIEELAGTVVRVCNDRFKEKDPKVAESWLRLHDYIMHSDDDPDRCPIISLQKFQQKAANKTGLMGDELMAAINFFHGIGDVLYHNIPMLRSFICINPMRLIDLFKAILRHDYATALEYQSSKFRDVMTLDRFKELKELLQSTGIMHWDLLTAEWTGKVACDDLGHLVSLLGHFGIAFNVAGSENNPQLLLPWLQPENSKQAFFPEKTQKLTFRQTFLGFFPPSFVEKLMVQTVTTLIQREHLWKGGVLGYSKYPSLNKSIKVLIKESQKETNSGKHCSVTFTVGAEKSSSASNSQDMDLLCKSIRPILDKAHQILQIWPEAIVETHYTTCDKILADGVPDNCWTSFDYFYQEVSPAVVKAACKCIPNVRHQYASSCTAES